MRIDRLDVRELHMRLKFPFETSFGVEQDRRILLVSLTSGDFVGVAECVAGEFPGYAYETTDTAWSVLKSFIAPAIVGQEYGTPRELLHALRFIRGHNMAVASVEMAFWDLQAKSMGVPLWQLIGGQARPIPVGISIGIQSSVDQTLKTVDRYLSEGYRRVKLKIKPGWDIAVVRAVREAHPDTPLTVDANSAYRLTHARTLRDLDQLGLDYIEQPLAHDDLFDHARLQAMLDTPICIDESIHSAADARKALEMGAGRIINLKVGRVRGHLEARMVNDVAEAFGAPVWCGGMLEAGVGRLHNLHLSTLNGFTLPGDTASSSRYWDEDIVEPAPEATDGYQRLPSGPGLGADLRWDVIDRLTADRWHSGSE